MLTQLKSIRQENENGFTLIELLVVILIIGILAAIAIPMFLNQRMAAIDATTVADTKTLATAIETEAIKTPYEKMTTGSFAGTPLSAGTQWAMKSDAKGYCLQTFNAGGDQYKAVDTAATYDSGNGGLNKTGVSCGAGGAGDAPGGSAMGALGKIEFMDSDSMDIITADGTYSYDGTAQTVTYAFDFKNLEAGKTYHILINAKQSQGSDMWSPSNAVFKDFTLSGGNSHVEATVNLKGAGSQGSILTAPDKVLLYRGFATQPGYSYVDIHDDNPLRLK